MIFKSELMIFHIAGHYPNGNKSLIINNQTHICYLTKSPFGEKGLIKEVHPRIWTCNCWSRNPELYPVEPRGYNSCDKYVSKEKILN